MGDALRNNVMLCNALGSMAVLSISAIAVNFVPKINPTVPIPKKPI
jgi:hypothetical protein